MKDTEQAALRALAEEMRMMAAAADDGSKIYGFNLRKWADAIDARIAELPQETQMKASDLEVAALLEATVHVSRGEPVSEFMESFPLVRTVMDLHERATSMAEVCRNCGCQVIPWGRE